MSKLDKINELLNVPQWYIITAVSGNEDYVVKNLKGKISSYGYNDRVEDIKIIKEKIISVDEFSANNAPSSVGRKLKNVEWRTIEKNGNIYYQKIKTEEKNKFSGYIFIKMKMDDDIWFIIRNTQLVTGIVGSSGKNAKPIPVSSEEIENILNFSNKDNIISQEQEKGKNVSNVYKKDDSIILESITYTCPYPIGTKVKIKSGNMNEEVGYIKSLNDAKGIATVEIEMFNRVNKVEVEYTSLEEVE